MNSRNERTFEVRLARNETPGCESVVHFNNAGAGLMPAAVVDAMRDHITLESTIGAYEAAEQRAEQIDHIYDAAAELLSCCRDEIAIVENATRAWDLVFYALPFEAGDRILTSQAEYASNYIAFLQVCRRTGAQVKVIPNDEHGQVSVAALRKLIDRRVKLIAITHVPTNGGMVNPAEEIGAVAREAGVLFLLDACQSVGQMPLSVAALQCDILTGSGRKYLRGPRGTGLLYIRRELSQRLEPAFLDLHAARWDAPDHYTVRADARRFENWEFNYAAKIGLAVAIDYALRWHVATTWARIQELADELREELARIPEVIVRDLGTVRSGIVSFTCGDRDPAVVRSALLKHRINVWVSMQSSTLLDMTARALPSVVRASVHYYNTTDEIARFVATLRNVMRQI